MNGHKGCLLIGNSRWHWAIENNKKWQYFDTAPQNIKINKHKFNFFRWAAVGHIPSTSFLKSDEKIKSKDLPILQKDNWLGIDRVFAAWGALQKEDFPTKNPKGIWIVDAGTILSLTRISNKGEFIGGQLVPGLTLQLSAMAKGAKNLTDPKRIYLPKDIFPIDTQEAMLRGAIHALIGVIIEAYNKDKVPIWICGGNAKIIYEELIYRKVPIIICSNLVLEGMANILTKIKEDQDHLK